MSKNLLYSLMQRFLISPLFGSMVPSVGSGTVEVDPKIVGLNNGIARVESSVLITPDGGVLTVGGNTVSGFSGGIFTVPASGDNTSLVYTYGGKTASAQIRYSAPVVDDEFPTIIIDLSSSDAITNYDFTGQFLGGNLTYTFSDLVDGVTASGPLLTVDPTIFQGTLGVPITATNSGGSAVTSVVVSVTVAEVPIDPPHNQVVAFTGNALLYTDDASVWSPSGNVDSTGLWQMGLYQQIGGSGTNPVVSSGDPSRGDRYTSTYENRNRLRRSSSADVGVNPDQLELGRHLVGTFIYDAGRTKGVHFQDGVWSGEGDFGSSIDVSSQTRFGAPGIPHGSPGFSTGSVFPFAIARGRGNPSTFLAWLWNDGDVRNPQDYDFSSDPDIVTHSLSMFTRNKDDDTPLPPDGLTKLGDGSISWSDVVVPWEGASSVVQSVSATSNSIEVTSVLQSGNWSGTPDVDLSKVTLSSHTGWGSVSATSVTIESVTAGTCTVSFETSRELYDGETVDLVFDRNWITFGTKKTSIGESFSEIPCTGNPKPTLVEGISFDGFSVLFQTPLRASRTADGNITWMEPGVIVSQYPPLKTEGNIIYNGAMKNPERSEGDLQGFFKGGQEAKSRYVSDLTVTYPMTMGNNDSFVGTIGNLNTQLENGGSTSKPVDIVRYFGIICKSLIPNVNSFSPELVGPPSLRGDWEDIDVEAALLDFTGTLDLSIDPLDMPSDIENSIRNLEYLNINLGMFRYVEMKREMGPSNGNGDMYGRNWCEKSNFAALLFASTNATESQRARIARLAITSHIQWRNMKRSQDGGHNGGILIWHVLGKALLSGKSSIGSLLNEVGGNEAQAFIHTAETVAKVTQPHNVSDGTYPKYNLRTDAVELTPSSIILRVGLTGSDRRDFARGVVGGYVVHEISGEERKIITSNDKTAKLTFVGGAFTTAVATDTFYIRPPDGIAVIGAADWVVKGNVDSRYFFGANTTYREFWDFSYEVLILHALGLAHPSFKPMTDWTVRTTQPEQFNEDIQLSHPHVKYVDYAGVTNPARQAWSDHWNTVKHYPQIS